jgi:integrase/recombinase XerD
MKNQKYLREFENYLLANNRSKETTKSYTRTVSQFMGLIKKPPKDITKEDIERYKYWANEIKHYDRNTLTPKYCAIKSFLEFLDIPDKEIKSFKLSPPRLEVKPKKPLTREEIQKMFEISKNNYRDNAILKTLYFTTIRNRELCNLNIEDIDFQRQKIRNISKGGHYDERNIHPDCLKAIGDYLALREHAKKGYENALFLNDHRERIGKTFLHMMIKKYATLAGIKKRVYPHLFRASSITHMAEAGATIPEIMAQSKHRSVDTLIKHYICPSEKHNKEVYLKTLSFNKKPERKSNSLEPEKPPQSQTGQTVQVPQNKEDKYIKLLRDGLINKEEFMKLITAHKKTDPNPLYG